MKEQQRTEPPHPIFAELQIGGLTSTIQLPITLYPSRWQAVVLLGICSLFVFIGILTVRKGETMGYYAGGFFALGLPIFALQFHPKAFYLHLTPDGFTFCNLFRACTVRWAHVAKFGVTSMGGSATVGWNFTLEHQPKGLAGDLARCGLGYEGALPDT
jgi:hypothetical protein